MQSNKNTPKINNKEKIKQIISSNNNSKYEYKSIYFSNNNSKLS